MILKSYQMDPQVHRNPLSQNSKLFGILNFPHAFLRSDLYREVSKAGVDSIFFTKLHPNCRN